jgi:hypothetical protein
MAFKNDAASYRVQLTDREGTIRQLVELATRIMGGEPATFALKFLGLKGSFVHPACLRKARSAKANKETGAGT